MAKKESKTNAVRILEKEGIVFEAIQYESEGFLDGKGVADKIHELYENMYKTLVSVGRSGNYYVFLIPIVEEIDLKKAAMSVSEKSISMLPLKDLTPITGYVRGGCTAIGMKKKFPVVIHYTAEMLEKMVVSGGRLGLQIKVKPSDLKKAANAIYADVTM